MKIANEKKHTNECTKIKHLRNDTQKQWKPLMKPYTLLAKPEKEIKYLQTMKLFKIYYKYTRRHDTRHGRAAHTARTHTHTHKQKKRYRLAAVPEKKGKKNTKAKAGLPQVTRG